MGLGELLRRVKQDPETRALSEVTLETKSADYKGGDKVIKAGPGQGASNRDQSPERMLGRVGRRWSCVDSRCAGM